MTEFKLGQMIYGVTSKGAIKTWRARVWGTPTEQPSDATIEIITQVKLDGKEVVRIEVITEGKNIGKSNETTAYEQAVSETESRYRKQIKRGYQAEIPTDLTKADTNALGLPRPMLAHPIDKVKKVEFPAHFQPKFDGHRALVTRQNGRMMMYSRGGDEITTMQHILDYLDDRVAEGEFLDGELYLHGELLQNIGSFIRKYREGISETIVYHVYDTMMDVPYSQRWEKLQILLNEEVEPGREGYGKQPAFRVPTYLVTSLEQALEYRDQFIKDGYEGGMLRIPDKGYEAGKKSRTLLKLKTFDDSEHLIVDVVEGKDRIVNDLELKVACFVCETPEGKRFEVTAHGDMYQKDRTWHERDSFPGKYLTVKHSGYTKDKIPWHPVALRLREDI